MDALDKFTESMSPMHKARAIKTLEMQVRYNGAEFITRRALIERKICEGATIAQSKSCGRVLQSPDGAFFDTKNITSIGLDYAAHIIAAR